MHLYMKKKHPAPCRKRAGCAVVHYIRERVNFLFFGSHISYEYRGSNSFSNGCLAIALSALLLSLSLPIASHIHKLLFAHPSRKKTETPIPQSLLPRILIVLPQS